MYALGLTRLEYEKLVRRGLSATRKLDRDRSKWQADAADEVRISRVGAEGVKLVIRLDVGNAAVLTDSVAMFVTFFQPVEGSILVPELGIDSGNDARNVQVVRGMELLKNFGPR